MRSWSFSQAVRTTSAHASFFSATLPVCQNLFSLQIESWKSVQTSELFWLPLMWEYLNTTAFKIFVSGFILNMSKLTQANINSCSHGIPNIHTQCMFIQTVHTKHSVGQPLLFHFHSTTHILSWTYKVNFHFSELWKIFICCTFTLKNKGFFFAVMS